MPRLSVVIPLYNEEHRLQSGLVAIHRFAELVGSMPEVILVDDGSQDGTLAEAYRRAPWEALILPRPHLGKGGALRAGVARASGDRILLTDVDWSVSPEETLRLLHHDADVVAAVREGAGARRLGEPTWRHLLGRAFNKVVQGGLLPGFQDTQCGCKLLRRDCAKALFSELRLQGWAYDVELLYLARRWGMRVQQVPVTWRYEADTRLSVLGDSWSMAWELAQIRHRARMGAYPAAAPPREMFDRSMGDG